MKMKKIVAVFSCLCMMCTAMTFPDSAEKQTMVSASAEETGTYENLTYKKYDDHIEITRCYTYAAGELEVPAQIDGLPVTIIGSSAFSACSGLTSVKIPDGVTTIGEGAFLCCFGLNSVTLPNSVTTIGVQAFNECSSLSSINIPDGITVIDNSVFSSCSQLTSINIPDSVTSIGNSAFVDCSALTSVVLPAGVTTIGEKAFLRCSGLRSVTMPDSVTSIATDAFRGCINLPSLTIENPYCEISNSYYTLGSPETTVISGYENSTAQTYAKESGYQFKSLGTAPGQEMPASSDDIAYMKENQVTLDFNKDGIIDASDAALVLTYAAESGAGKVSSLEEFIKNHNL